jgi:tetratricopeptide (TPR) repeat protein
VRKLANNLISNWDKGIPPEAVHFQVRGRLADLSAEYLDALAQEADDPALLKELAEAHLKLGQEYAYQFINLEKAEASFRRTETIARQLIASAPDDLGAKDLLAQSLEKHNEFFGERAPEASLQNHLQIVRLREEILAANPDDEQALRRAGQSNDWCGLAYKKLGRREEAVYFARRAEEYYERRVEVLDRSANTPEDRAKLASTLIRLAFHRAEHLNEIERAVANSRRGFEIAQSVYAEKPDNDFIVTAGYEYGMILKKAGEHRRAIEALRVSVETARIFFARGVSAYIKGREFRSLLEIAESLNELGETQAAVETAKEALEVRRKWMGLANNHLSGEQNWRHGLFFLGGGKLLARMGKFDEAEGVFSESEQSLLKVLKDSPDKLINRQTLAVLYMTMGDFYGGLGVCSFEKMKSIGTITNGVDAAYCSPDSNKFTTNHPRLQKARSFYQKAVNFLTELEAANAATPPDREILRIGREKIATSSERLQGKS